MDFDIQDLVAPAVAFIAAVSLTPVVRALAHRCNMVSRPSGDRWAKKPKALLGGVAIFAAVSLASLFCLPRLEESWPIFAGSAFLFLLGLVDDFLHIKPYQKLIGQVMGACLVLFAGLELPWTPSPLLNMGITVFWLVGITNAINLLDNMDGLAGGVAAIAAVFLAVNFFAAGQTTEAMLVLSFAAALGGFLIYNVNPASIFMGDCGSMFIGFFLASAALLQVSGGRFRSVLPVLAVPVLLLLIPIFDTTFVTLLRKLAGRAASQGGRDHTSHRLVALGLTERRAVGLLYALAMLSGMLALCVRNAPPDVSLLLIVGFSIGLTILGIHLAGVKVYEQGQELPGGQKPLMAFLVNLSYKRRMFEVLLDIILIPLAYYTAHLLYFGPLGEGALYEQLAQTIPLLIVFKLGVFLIMGVYRGLWRYIGLNDLIVHVKAVVLSSAVCVVAFVLLFRFENMSRTVFVLDGLLLLVFVSGSRIAFRVLRGWLPMARPSGRRVLIYGAGDAGELLLREMRNNPTLQCVAVGFADDDPLKTGKQIHGLKVLGGNGRLPGICKELRVDDVYISSSRITEERVREIQDQCRESGIGLKRMRLYFESLHQDGDELQN